MCARTGAGQRSNLGKVEADFRLLIDWISAAQRDRDGCFKCEGVDDAAANDLLGAVPACRIIGL